MSRGYKTRLSDVLQSIQKIETYLMHINRDAFLSGSTETDAILYQLIVIGEAVKMCLTRYVTNTPKSAGAGLQVYAMCLPMNIFG